MIVRFLGLGGVVGGVIVGAMSCGSASRPPGEQPANTTASESPGTDTPHSDSSQSSATPSSDQHDGERPLSCTMAQQACPSSKLPRISTQLDQAGWTKLSALAKQGVVAIAWGERVELLEACRLRGRYHEGAAAPDSPGRAWSSDRLVYVPDEVKNCGRATHFVASFAIAGEADGEAIVLPLPCPPLGSKQIPTGCIGAGLDDAGRKAKAGPMAQEARPLLDDREMERGLPLALDIAALIPDAWGYMTLLDALRALDHEAHGGCLWLSEAAFAVHTMIPDHELSIVDVSKGRIAPSHEYASCDTRPSLLTCFPGRFVPGTGDNCW